MFRTTVILTSDASVPGVVHHAPCLGSDGSAGLAGRAPKSCLEDPYRSSALGIFENKKNVLDFRSSFVNIDEHCCTSTQNHSTTMKLVVLSCLFIGENNHILCTIVERHAKFDANRCTIVLPSLNIDVARRVFY